MCRNEGLYPDPGTFNPERFMDQADDETRRKRDPRNFVFGFGRRLVYSLAHCDEFGNDLPWMTGNAQGTSSSTPRYGC
jgi:hypothetical protein